MFQSFQLLGNLTALENVMLPLELAARKDARKAATEMLGRVGLAERLGHYPKVLSAASSSASRWRGPSWCSRRCCCRRAHRQPGLRHRRNRDGADVRPQPGAGHHAGPVTHDSGIAARCEHRITIEAGRIVA